MEQTMNLELGKHFEHFITQMVESGRYSSQSEVIIAALEILKEKEDELAHSLEP